MIEVIKNSRSINEVATKVFGYGNGTSYKKVKKFINDNHIDISHFGLIRKITYPKINKVCPVCGEIFETKQGHRTEKIVCSHSCSNTYFRSGTSNPNYKEDDDLNGEVKYVKICFRHHKRKCVCCNEEKIVAVHHYDGNKKNNKPENLIPLCPTHHTYWHSRFRQEVKPTIDEYIRNFKNKNE